VSKRASPARFGPARFWPVLNGLGRASPTRQNGLFFWARPVGWRPGGPVARPAILFLICSFCGPKSDFKSFHFKFS